MPLRIPCGRRAALDAAAATVIALFLFAALIDHALAQSSPFGVARPPAAPPAGDGFAGWILAKQAEFFRALSGLVRAAKADGSAVWGLLGVSFLYGIFHAAGPGHGKAVISSYVVANEETWRRGIVLSFASALLQALVAILIVAIAAVLFNATAPSMNAAVRWIEIASYTLIALIGARLLWVKGRAFLAALRHRAREARCAGRGGHLPPSCITTHHHQAHAHDTITVIRMTIIPAIRMDPSRRSSPVPAAGSAGSRRSSRWACGRVREPFLFSSLRSRRASFGPEWLQPL